MYLTCLSPPAETPSYTRYLRHRELCGAEKGSRKGCGVKGLLGLQWFDGFESISKRFKFIDFNES